MPLALEPNATFRVVLESDKDKANPPYFELRFLSGRGWKELTRQAGRIKKAKSGPAAIDVVYDMIRTGLAGWDNMTDPATGEEIPYDPADLDRLLTIKEANELMAKFRDQGITVAAKKKSDSPSDSDTGKSAKTAQVRKNAQTNPPPPKG